MKTFKVGLFNSFLILIFLVASSFVTDIGTLQYYKGTIGNNTKIQMSLDLDGSQMKGSFIYEESGEIFILIGRASESTQSVMLNVINDKDVNVARIQARYYTNDLDEIIAIKGGIIDLKKNQRKVLNLEKVAEFIARSKINSDIQHY